MDLHVSSKNKNFMAMYAQCMFLVRSFFALKLIKTVEKVKFFLHIWNLQPTGYPHISLFQKKSLIFYDSFENDGHVLSVYGPRMKFLWKFTDQVPINFFSLTNFFCWFQWIYTFHQQIRISWPCMLHTWTIQHTWNTHKKKFP